MVSTPIDEAGVTGQIAAPVQHGSERLWLIVGPRPAGHAFTAQDTTVLSTLATLATQALSRVAHTDEIRHIAEHDALTGLATRSVLSSAINVALARDASLLASRSASTSRLDTDKGVRSPRSATSLLFCDIDDVKTINDTYGHRVGDLVLVELGVRLRRAVRPGDLVARLGGDEFAILLPHTGSAAADDVRVRLARELEAAHLVDDLTLHVRASIGAAIWPPASSEADRDMYAQK